MEVSMRRHPLAGSLGRFACIGSLAALAAGTSALAAPIALVTDGVGAAQHAGEPLRILSELEPGQELALAADTTVVVFYLVDGAEWTLRGPGRFRLVPRTPEALGAGTPPPQRRPGPAAYRDIRLRADRLQQGGIVLRSAADEPMALQAPAKGEVVLSPDVRFRWKPLEAAGAYQFELVDQTGRKILAAETPDTELALPLAVQLEPGHTYYWAVRARSANAAQPLYRVAEFRVIDAPTRRRIEAARPQADAPFSERALFIALLEDLGARSEAADQRSRLAVERPVGWAPSK
jgi:hypothetical protein